MESQKQKLKLGRKLVFTPLPRYFNAESETFPAEDAVQHGQSHLALVRAQYVQVYNLINP